jgi:hypothetical protein
MHYDEISPIYTTGLVQKQDLRKRNFAKAMVHKVRNERNIRCHGRADIVRLEEFDLFTLIAARTPLGDQRDIAVLTPVEDLFYRRFAHHTQ